MPRQPHWFQHVAPALAELRASPSPVLDRVSLEKLLHVSRRTAIRLLHLFGGFQAGRTFLIAREELIAALENVAKRRNVWARAPAPEPAGRGLGKDTTRLAGKTGEAPGGAGCPLRCFPALRHADRPPRGAGGRVCAGEELLGRLYELVRIAGEDLEAV